MMKGETARESLLWHSMNERERNAVVAEVFGDSILWPRYANDLSSIAGKLRSLGFRFEVGINESEVSFARVGTGEHTHTAMLHNPAESLCVAFLRFMGRNVQVIATEPQEKGAE